MTVEKAKVQSSDRIFDGSIELFLSFFKIAREAFKTRFYKKIENWVLFVSLVTLIWFMFYKGHYGFLLEILPFDFIKKMFASFVINSSKTFLFTLVTLFTGMVMIFFIGIKPYRLFMLYQKGLDHLNLKSGLDHKPKLLSVEAIDENRTRILVKSTGLGEDRYRAKLDDLRAAVGQKVESVYYLDKDNTCLEIFFARKQLEAKMLYADYADQLKRPYSFIVGKSQKGLVTENLEDVPHYMVAGATGGGKSVSFKSMLLGLLESSTKLQLYLFDFKRVEMNDFTGLPNVEIIQSEMTAQLVLTKLEKEMERRYKILEEKGEKKIDPYRDNLDRIVVGIDECTDLTSRVPKSHPLYQTIEKSRISLDHLARKARASGIHLIFATQKIDKDSLDTRVQENVEGRLALRMNTMENSVRVLQNSMAYHLPSIPGRAIWKKGASYIEVQSPFISDEDLRARIQALSKSKKFKNVKMFKIDDSNEEEINEKKGFVKD
jgi:hypothetical protein